MLMEKYTNFAILLKETGKINNYVIKDYFWPNYTLKITDTQLTYQNFREG